jgi:hypothetical protein
VLGYQKDLRHAGRFALRELGWRVPFPGGQMALTDIEASLGSLKLWNVGRAT